MYKRIVKISKKRSFFLFGARGTGKSTLLEELFTPVEALVVDLLDVETFDKLQAYPEEFEPLVLDAINNGKFIVVDEIQKIPVLLNTIHKLVQKKKARFALTGSSARKLKHGSANMLAGRASVYNLFPLLFTELEADFNLQNALEWGTLPEAVTLESEEEKINFLKAYTDTYLWQEIITEQIVRNLPPFKRFLNVAAQMNGKIINATKIANDVRTDASNVKNYFEILEDTLLGFSLPGYHTSIRKQQRQNPKFYWIDTGIVRALQKTLGVKIQPSTSSYGDYFEAFIISQIRAGLEYQPKQYQLSYLQTKDGAEIDLIVERAGEKTICIEIKSSANVRKEDLNNLAKLSADMKNSKAICVYNGKQRIRYGQTEVIPWQEAFREFHLAA